MNLRYWLLKFYHNFCTHREGYTASNDSDYCKSALESTRKQPLLDARKYKRYFSLPRALWIWEQWNMKIKRPADIPLMGDKRLGIPWILSLWLIVTTAEDLWNMMQRLEWFFNLSFEILLDKRRKLKRPSNKSTISHVPMKHVVYWQRRFYTTMVIMKEILFVHRQNKFRGP